jgi:hypothetical protein
MNLNIRGERRRRQVIAMISDMLEIDDKKLDAHIKNGELPKEVDSNKAKNADSLAKARAAKMAKKT